MRPWIVKYDKKYKYIFPVFWKCLILFCLLSLFLSSKVLAATYHVRTDGHDTASGANNTTDGTTGALLTITQCLSAHATSPGDICNVHAGTYGEVAVTANSGTAGNFITIQANGTDAVSVSRIKINGHNYIKVNGITVPSSSTWGNPGIYIKGNNCFISNNKITGSGTKPGATNYALETHGNNNTIDHNVIDGESTTVGSFFIVFSVSGTGNVFTKNVVKNIYDQERVWDAGGDDAEFMSSDKTVVRGNEVYNFTWSGGGVHPDIFQGVNHTTNIANTWLIENNYFHDLNSQIGINEIPSVRSSGWMFRNNIFANITQRAMLANLNSKWYNNTFYQVQNGNQNIFDYATSSNFEFKNNIIIGSSTNTNLGMLNRTSNGGSPSLSNNYYGLPMDSGYTARNGSTIAGYGDTNFINGGDPMFVAAYNNCTKNKCDFRLKFNSPLIDKGIDLSDSWSNATDYSGTPRPKGTKWNIGANGFIDKKPLPPGNVGF